MTEAYLGPCQTSTIELFGKTHFEKLKANSNSTPTQVFPINFVTLLITLFL